MVRVRMPVREVKDNVHKFRALLTDRQKKVKLENIAFCGAFLMIATALYFTQLYLQVKPQKYFWTRVKLPSNLVLGIFALEFFLMGALLAIPLFLWLYRDFLGSTEVLNGLYNLQTSVAQTGRRLYQWEQKYGVGGQNLRPRLRQRV